MATHLMYLFAMLLIGCNTGEESKTDTGDTDPDTDTVVDTGPKVDTGDGCTVHPDGYDMDCAEARFTGDTGFRDWDDPDILGISVLGDIDADGSDDFLLGSYQEVAIFLGPVAPDAHWRILPDADILMHLPDYWGWGSNRMGDITGDGYDDLMLYGSNVGTMFIYEGGPDPYILLEQPVPSYHIYGDGVGSGSVYGLDAADCQGSLIPVPLDDYGGRDAGAVYLVEAPLDADMDLVDATARLYGSADAWAGYEVSGTGDVNGDGVPDALIMGYSLEWLSFGPFSGNLPLADSDATFLTAGSIWSARIVGDTDGDGLADLAFTDCLHSDAGDAGKLYVILGGDLTGSLDLDTANTATWQGESDDHLGYTMDRAGDYDRDSFFDILVSAGDSAAVIPGPTEGTHVISEAPVVFVDDHTAYGTFVAGDFDSNGDGSPDVLLFEDGDRAVPGRAYLFYDGPRSQ